MTKQQEIIKKILDIYDKYFTKKIEHEDYCKWDKKEFTKFLFGTFKYLYRGHKKDITQSLLPFGLDCGNGWYNLLYNLSVDLEAERQKDKKCKVEVVQVKEKLASLRYYCHQENENMEKIINDYELLSEAICEECGVFTGENNTKTHQGWLFNHCNDCHKKFLENRKREKNLWGIN